jgi:hypothetical protein
MQQAAYPSCWPPLEKPGHLQFSWSYSIFGLIAKRVKFPRTENMTVILHTMGLAIRLPKTGSHGLWPIEVGPWLMVLTIDPTTPWAGQREGPISVVFNTSQVVIGESGKACHELAAGLCQCVRVSWRYWWAMRESRIALQSCEGVAITRT